MSFSSIRNIRSSRKARVCDECRQSIPVGSPYSAVAFMFEGEFQAYDAHNECLTFASAVLDDWGDGRPLLCESDPEEHDFAKGVLRHPPSPEMLARLSPAWRQAVAGLLEPVPGVSVPERETA